MAYLRSAFKELFAEDGLMVMGRGLGIQELFAKFALYYSKKAKERSIVMCLNCFGLEDSLGDLFSSHGASASEMPQVTANLLVCFPFFLLLVLCIFSALFV
jgi:hypothetical protein